MTSSNFNYEDVNSSSHNNNFPAALPLPADQQSAHYANINSGLQPIVNSSNNYNASCNGMNDNIFVPASQSINNGGLNLSSNNYNNMDASRNGMSGTFTFPGQSVNNNGLNSNNYMDVSCNGMRDTIPGQPLSTTSNGSIAQSSP